MNKLYQTIGISKQAVYNYQRRQMQFEAKLEKLIVKVEKLRKEHPGCGVEKMYYMLSPDFIGRDKFIEIFMDLGFGIKRKKNYKRTTYPTHIYYPNLIKGMEVKAPNVIWQSDITYIKIGDKFYYAVFIIDVYTKEIVGYNLSPHMRATANMKALMMATKQYGYPKIHHSDRGSQYVYKEYIALLKNHGTQISMALSAQDNAYAERINRTIKEEYIEPRNIKDYNTLERSMKKAVKHYNLKRIHNHLNRDTPANFRKKMLTLLEQERPTLLIYNDQNNETTKMHCYKTNKVKKNRIINPKTVNLI